MQLCWRRLAPNEPDHELVWLTISITALVMAAAWLNLNLPWPQCAFHALTGLPCLTCGATRSAIQFFHRNFGSAWSLNPLAFTFYCAITIFDFYAFVVLIARAPRLRLIKFSRPQKQFVHVLVLLLLAANWVYLLWMRPV